MKVFYKYYKEPFLVTGENYFYYFSEGFLEQGETYLLKLDKKECDIPCDVCGTRTKKYEKEVSRDEFNVGSWNYLAFKTKQTVHWCPKCDMIKALEKYNKTDWKLETWSNDTREPGYQKDICHNCKYIMWHSLTWCAICGQPMSKHKMSNADLKKNYPDYRVGY